MSYNIDDRKRLFLRDKIVKGSRQYRNKLMDKNILIICEDGQDYKVRFLKDDFIHLTGVKSNLSDSRFLENSYSGFLSIGNINPNQKYNWSTLKSKANRIEKIDKIIYADVQDSLFMEKLHTNTYEYDVAIRNTKMNACVGFKEEMNKARTLRKSTNSTNAESTKKIIAIFSKKTQEQLYNELIYINNVKTLIKIKPSIKNMLSHNIVRRIESINREK